MKRIAIIFGAVLSMIVLMSAMKTVEYVDLAKKGIPVVVDVPTGSEVSGGILNGMTMGGVTTHSWDINSGDFSLEVTMEDVEAKESRWEYLKYTKNILEADPSFVRYVEADNHGFLVKMNYNGIVEYEFYHVLIKENRAIEFSVGRSTDDYGLANIQEIYHAALTAK